MIKRLEGYTGDGFQERNGYIILHNDLNNLELKKRKNEEKKVGEIIEQNRKKIFVQTSSQVDNLNQDLSRNVQVINNSLDSNSFKNNDLSSGIDDNMMKSYLDFNNRGRSNFDNNCLKINTVDKLDK